MARGYQTASPSFVNDITYQPPWEFIEQALATKQKGYDDVLQKTELVKNLLDVKHLNFEDERAKNIKEYYNTRMDDLTNQLASDPNNYNKVLPQLRNLTREIDTDRKEGNIAAIENRYNAVQKWMSENKDLREKEPDTYNRLFAHWYGDIKNRSAEDIGATYAGVKGLQRPDLEWEKIMKDIKENGFTDTDGKYYKSVEGVEPERIENIAWNRLKSNPNFSGYINQMGNTLGMKQYYEKPFELRNAAGETINSEDYRKLTDEQKKTYKRFVNSDNPFASDLEMATGISAYQKINRNKADEYGLKSADYKYDSALQSQKDKAALAKQQAKGDIDMQLLEKRYQLMGELEKQKAKAELEATAKAGGADAAKALTALEQLEGKETFGFISNNPITYESNLAKVQQGDEVANQREQSSRNFARTGLAKPGTEEHRFLEHLDAELAKGGKTKDQIVADYVNAVKDTNMRSSIALKGMNFNRNSSDAGGSNYVQGKILTNLSNKYSNLYDRYANKKEKYFQDHANDVTEVALHALTPQTSNILASTINNNPDSYYTVDEKGNRLTSGELPKIKAALQAFGANPKEKLGVKVQYEDGSTGYILPKRSEGGTVQTTTMKNLILDSGLAEPNSALYRELKDEKLNDLQSKFEQAYPNPKTGNKEILYEVDGQKIPIHKIGKDYYIVDPNNPRNANRIGDLNNVLDIIYPASK